MLFAQRGPTMVPRDHRWPTLCEAGAKVGQLTAASLIWSRSAINVRLERVYSPPFSNPCHPLPPRKPRIWRLRLKIFLVTYLFN